MNPRDREGDIEGEIGKDREREKNTTSSVADRSESETEGRRQRWHSAQEGKPPSATMISAGNSKTQEEERCVGQGVPLAVG